jgi:hypothetical protein
MIRDKRGYETTYLIHVFREGARQRSRILYVFRTPGGVHGGRVAFEPEARQNIELSHPAIAFDWKAIMADRQVVDDRPDPRRGRRPRRTEEARPAAAPPKRASAATAPTPSRPPIPSTVEGSTPDARMEFLALWYSIVRDRISERTSDPTRRETLLALAERLNPAAWTDADEIAAGLEGATEALERLSRVFSKRRRRSRRSTTRPAESVATADVSEAPPSTELALSTGVPPSAETPPATEVSPETPVVVETVSQTEIE